MGRLESCPVRYPGHEALGVIHSEAINSPGHHTHHTHHTHITLSMSLLLYVSRSDQIVLVNTPQFIMFLKSCVVVLHSKQSNQVEVKPTTD